VVTRSSRTTGSAAANHDQANGDKANSDKATQLSALAALGLAVGEAVRFRRADRSRWQSGKVSCMERDGSIGITDTNGAARAVPLAHVQVEERTRRRRPGAAPRWEPLADRAGRTEQLKLL
jgi:hypothetical protein